MSKEAVDRLRERAQNEQTVFALSDLCRAHEATIAALEKQNAKLRAALNEVVAFWDAITMEDAVNEIHVKARAALAALQPSTQEVSND